MKEIRLRALEPEDLELMYEAENDRSLWNVGTTNVPYSREALRQFILSTTNDIYADRQLRLIAENKDGEAVGMVDLINFDPQNQKAEVGLVVKREMRKRGYATEMLHELMRYAREVIHLHQLYAIVAEDNKESEALFEKGGFSAEGTLREWLFDGEKYINCRVMQLFL